MIGDVKLPRSPLIGAGLVLADAGAAAVHVAHSILVFLLANVPEVEQGTTAGIVDDHVFKMGDTPEVGHFCANKSREGLVTDTGRAKVVALDISVTITVKVHGSQSSKSSTERVTSDLDLGGWVGTPQFGNLIEDLAESALLGSIEALMNLAVAIWV